MDPSQARAHFGISAKSPATRQGIDWTPRIGRAADTVEFPLADVVASWGFTFADAAAYANLEPGNNWTVTLGAAIDEITISGVTGTGASSLNVVYTASAAVNGMPCWTNGTASIRWIEGFWHVYLAGVSQFIMEKPFSLPSPLADTWMIHASGAATGIPTLVWGSGGAAAVLDAGNDAADYEGTVLPDSTVESLLVECSAGTVAFAFGTGVIVLGAGQHLQLALPGGEAAWMLSGSLAVVSCTAAAACSLHLLAAAV